MREVCFLLVGLTLLNGCFGGGKPPQSNGTDSNPSQELGRIANPPLPQGAVEAASSGQPAGDNRPLATQSASTEIATAPGVMTNSNNVRSLRDRYPSPRGLAVRTRDVFPLELHEGTFNQNRLLNGSLFRELCRQALLISARHELGLSTRDRALREEFGEATPPTDWPLSVITSVDREYAATVTVVQDRTDGTRVLWEQVMQLDPALPYESLATAAERLSRNEFRKLLVDQGFGPARAAASPGDDAVDPDVEQKLNHFTDLSQFAALRALHQSIREDGETPRRLEGLVRAYANLWLLTNAHSSAMAKVFAARSLLYAERLRAGYPASPSVVWGQAYSQSLIGLPASAIRTLEAGQASTAGADPPSWLPAIIAYSHGDVAQLRQISEDRADDPLAPVLLWRSSRHQSNDEVRFRDIAEILEREPDCLRVMLDVAASESLGAKASSRLLLERLPGVAVRGLAEIADLPPSVASLLDQDRLSSGEGFAALTAELKRVGAAGVDKGEPSLDLAAQLLRESAFISAWHQLDYEQNALAIPVGQRATELAGWAAGHPYVDGLSARAAVGQEWMTRGQSLLHAMPTAELELWSYGVAMHFYNSDRVAARNLGLYANSHMDGIADELYLLVGRASSDRYRDRTLARLVEVAPEFPSTIEAQLRWSPDALVEQLTAIEERFAQNASGLERLSSVYLDKGDTAAAERCAQSWIGIDPGYSSWQHLARAKRLAGDTEGWLDACEESLKHPVFGLEHAETRSAIAEHFLKLEQPQKALPYAEAAAQSGAAWAMLRAAEVNEKLGKMDEAARYQEFTSRRYEDQSLNWFLWCLRTGAGDISEARSFAKQMVASWGSEISRENQMRAAMIEMTEGNWNAAQQRMLRVARADSEPFYSWMAAVLADATGASSERSEMLQRVITLKDSGDEVTLPGTEGIAAYVDAQLSQSPAARLDLERLDREIAVLRPGAMTNLWFFLSQILAHHDQRSESLEFLQRAANSPYPDLWTQFLAAHFLRAEGQKVELRDDEFVPLTAPRNERGAKILQQNRPLQTARFLQNDHIVFSDSKLAVFDGNPATGESSERMNARGVIVDATVDGNRVLLATESMKSWEIWSQGSDNAEHSIPVAGASLRAARFLRDDPGRIVAVDMRNDSDTIPGSVIAVWNLSTKQAVWSADLENRSIRGLHSGGPDGCIVVVGQTEGRTGWIGEFAASDGARIREIDLPGHPVERAAVAANGTRGVTLSGFGEIRVWNLETLEASQRLWQPGTTYAALSADGNLLATAGTTRVNVFDLSSGKLLGVFDDHVQPVNQVAFSPQGDQLVTVSSDMTARTFTLDKLSHPDAALPSFVHVNSIGMSFTPLPAGQFMMGERNSFQPTPGYERGGTQWEHPRHSVTLTRPYYFSQFETTVGQFRKFIEATGYVTDAERNGGGKHLIAPQGEMMQRREFTWRTPGIEQDDSHPVVQVTWNDANAFCSWLSKSEGRRYRLPTEAEWEYGCRAGSPLSWSGMNRFPKGVDGLGNTADSRLMDIYDFYGTAEYTDDGYAFSAPVGRFKPNAWGVYDAHGNAYEWCSDYWGPNYYQSSPAVDPPGPDAGRDRVQRSGSFLTHLDNSRAAHRAYDNPSVTDSSTGFRVMLEMDAN